MQYLKLITIKQLIQMYALLQLSSLTNTRNTFVPPPPRCIEVFNYKEM